jgi:hypothetical protein
VVPEPVGIFIHPGGAVKLFALCRRNARSFDYLQFDPSFATHSVEVRFAKSGGGLGFGFYGGGLGGDFGFSKMTSKSTGIRKSNRESFCV